MSLCVALRVRELAGGKEKERKEERWNLRVSLSFTSIGRSEKVFFLLLSLVRLNDKTWKRPFTEMEEGKRKKDQGFLDGVTTNEQSCPTTHTHSLHRKKFSPTIIRNERNVKRFVEEEVGIGAFFWHLSLTVS